MWKALNGTNKAYEVVDDHRLRGHREGREGRVRPGRQDHLQEEVRRVEGLLLAPLPEVDVRLARGVQQGLGRHPEDHRQRVQDRLDRPHREDRDQSCATPTGGARSPSSTRSRSARSTAPPLADAFANGQIDWYDIGSSVDNFQRAKTTPGAVIRQAISPDYSHITFNGADSSILKDAKLRVALMKGIDTKTIAKALLGQMLKGDAAGRRQPLLPARLGRLQGQLGRRLVRQGSREEAARRAGLEARG